MALGDVSIQPQRCAVYMLCLESYGSKSCVNPSFQPPKVTFGAVWMSLLDTAFLSKSCSSALCCQEPGCNLSESCTFIGLYLLVNLIYSFQSATREENTMERTALQVQKMREDYSFSQPLPNLSLALLRASLNGLP